MRKPIRLHPAALAEAEAAADWYRERSQRAAQDFLGERRTVDRVAENPSRFPHFAYGTRRVLLERFPYLIVFRETPPPWKS